MSFPCNDDAPFGCEDNNQLLLPGGAGSNNPSVLDIDVVPGGAEERQLESTPPSETIKCFQVFSSGWKCVDCKKPVPVGSSESAVRKHIKAHHPNILLDGETYASVHRKLLAALRRVSTLLANQPPSSTVVRYVWRYKCMFCPSSFGERYNFYQHCRRSRGDCRRAYPVRTKYGMTPCGRFVEMSSAKMSEEQSDRLNRIDFQRQVRSRRSSASMPLNFATEAESAHSRATSIENEEEELTEAWV